MPFKGERKRQYDREWRKRALDEGRCVRCGIKLIEGEGRTCVNCSSRTIRNLMAIVKGSRREL